MIAIIRNRCGVVRQAHGTESLGQPSGSPRDARKQMVTSSTRRPHVSTCRCCACPASAFSRRSIFRVVNDGEPPRGDRRRLHFKTWHRCEPKPHNMRDLFMLHAQFSCAASLHGVLAKQVQPWIPPSGIACNRHGRDISDSSELRSRARGSKIRRAQRRASLLDQ